MRTSVILQTATRFLQPLLLLFSFFLLLAGHNEPGGGFAGGLVAAAAVILHALAYGVDSARRTLVVDPRTLIAAGLLVATAAGIWALAAGKPLLTGLWRGGLGTPLVFDVGVYLVVIGGTLLMVFALMEE
jgi:multicomponent Na+:H+ antiporter subunit B